MQIEKHKSLKHYNTLGFDEHAELYAAVANEAELLEAINYAAQHKIPVFVLGSGSNIVLTQPIKGLVIHLTNNDIQYISGHSEGEHSVIAGAGTNWHELVLDTLSQGYRGLENLSLIPGTVGAAPVQNIGAYGVELMDRFISLRALHTPSNTFKTLRVDDCQFSYRDSLFKQNKGNYIITSVTLNISHSLPLVTHYTSLAEQLTNTKNTELTAQIISDTVCKIRQSRLPDPAELGNAGSFFHNPVISSEQFEELQKQHPNIVSYKQDNGSIKLAAGWLIDQLGYRAFKYKGVGVHEKQALVLVNHENGTGKDLLTLAKNIQNDVLAKYGVQLNIEPLVI